MHFFQSKTSKYTVSLCFGQVKICKESLENLWSKAVFLGLLFCQDVHYKRRMFIGHFLCHAQKEFWM